MKDRINEHDMTKKMMSMIRGGYQTVLREQSEDVQAVDIEKNTPIYKDELKKIKENLLIPAWPYSPLLFSFSLKIK